MIPKVDKSESTPPTRDALSKAPNYMKGQVQRTEFIEYLNALLQSSSNNDDTCNFIKS